MRSSIAGIWASCAVVGTFRTPVFQRPWHVSHSTNSPPALVSGMTGMKNSVKKLRPCPAPVFAVAAAVGAVEDAPGEGEEDHPPAENDQDPAAFLDETAHRIGARCGRIAERFHRLGGN
ncbi:hypothetical protein [Actinomadura madurae]|uniref:hypothetical protein n=1 Tax=Actinomadura madurae TaxID=1993 RepID=UPI0020D2552E|nr:hypothetical protein [Actinomadura madurae]MCP9949476.1 hypothetical protein [Actinomadura madurae]MCP9978722.1 hypothetical protein [Actinomadura madurae]